MSRLRAISSGIRSAIAVVAVWALMFGVATTGAAAGNAANPVLKTSASGGLFACFKRHMTHQADLAGEKTPEKRSKENHCPDCCLAAHAATAVLPERLATIARPSQTPRPVSYLAATSREPESFSSRTGNGARAPPRLL